MPVQSTVMARNLRPGPTVISSDPRGSQYVEWQGADDPSGGDVQLVPEEIVNSVPFVRAIQRGILTIENAEDNPELLDRIELQNKAFRDRVADARQEAAVAIDRTENRDLVVQPCIGPSTKGTGTCGEDVTTPEKTKDDKPALCGRHAHLAAEYVPTEEVADGQSHVVWKRAMLGERERQQF